MRHSLFVLLGAAVTVGCSNSLWDIPGSRRTGIFTVIKTPQNSETYTASVVGEFYTDNGQLGVLPNARSATDSCYPPVTFSDSVPAPTVLPFLNAGDSVTLQTGSAIAYLKPDTINSVITYVKRGIDSIPYVPGGVMSFSVPGASGGMSAGTLDLKIAEPIAFTITDPGRNNDSLVVAWNYAGQGDSSAVTAFFQYNLGNASQSEIFCIWPDRGERWVPANLLTGWRGSSTHRVQGARFRTQFLTNGDQLLYGLSEFKVQKTTFP